MLTAIVLSVASGPRASSFDWAQPARAAPSPVRSSIHGDEAGSRCDAAASLINGLTPKLLEAFNVSGMSVGLVCNHSVALSSGFGMADRKKKIQASDTTRYQIASNSKLFTATLSLALADEGKLDLDKPVRDAFPGFVFQDTYGAESITPRDLMSHRTGLPRHDRITFASRTRQGMMEAVGTLPLDKPVRYQPGEYNNLMLVAAGVVAEHAGGAQWEELVAQKIFAPLDMSDTSANLSSAKAATTPTLGSLAVPYAHDAANDVFVPLEPDNADAGAPCGGIVSSVRDMLKWQRMHLRQAAVVDEARPGCTEAGAGAPICLFFPSDRCCAKAGSSASAAADGALRTRSDHDERMASSEQGARPPHAQGVPPGGPLLLEPATWRELVAPNSIFPMLTHPFGGYSLGLWVEPWGRGPDGALDLVLHHEGDLAGMASMQFMLPMHGASLVVLSNENESPARFVLALSVLDTLLGVTRPAPFSWEQTYLAYLSHAKAAAAVQYAALQKEIASTPPAGRTPCLALAAYEGSFVHPSYGNATISLLAHSSRTRAAQVRAQPPGKEEAPDEAPPHLHLCGAATLASVGASHPSTPACARLLHVYFETFALGPTAVEGVTPETLLITFRADGDVGVTHFEAPVEPKVPPIAFVKA